MKISARAKTFLGIVTACVGGGAAYVFSAKYFAVSADTVGVVNSDSSAVFLIVSLLVALIGIILLIATIVTDRK